MFRKQSIGVSSQESDGLKNQQNANLPGAPKISNKITLKISVVEPVTKLTTVISAYVAPLPPRIKATGRLLLLPSIVATASLPLVNIPGCTPPVAANVDSGEARGATPTATRDANPLITKKSPSKGSGIARESTKITSKQLGEKSIANSSIVDFVAGSSVPHHILMTGDRPVSTPVSVAATKLPLAGNLGRTLPAATCNVGSEVFPATATITSAKALGMAPSVSVGQEGDTKPPLTSSFTSAPTPLEHENTTLDKYWCTCVGSPHVPVKPKSKLTVKARVSRIVVSESIHNMCFSHPSYLILRKTLRMRDPYLMCSALVVHPSLLLLRPLDTF